MSEPYILVLADTPLYLAGIEDMFNLQFVDNPYMAMTFSQDQANALANLLIEQTPHTLLPQTLGE